MSWIDWSIVLTLVAFLVVTANYTKRYTISVADFLAANRSAGRYMLAVAGNMSSLGAISILAWYEMYYKAGFSAVWWQMMMMPMGIIIALSGWVVYRFRQTRAMTMAQFFEMRYSRRFRIFTGILAFVSGTLNFGIFPSVGARFFIYFCGFPATVSLGQLHISTFPLTMFVLLALALYFTFAGGQIVIMVTDFLQGVFCNIVFIILIFYMLIIFDWSQITQALLTAPEEASHVNPFHSTGVDDFNVWYFIIGTIALFYNMNAWQGSQGYNCSALNPHEQKMGRVLGRLRALTQSLLFVIVPIGAYMIMHHPNFAHDADKVNNILAGIDNATIKQQMLVPVASSFFLAKGLLGCMCAVILAAFLTTHNTYLHSWGSIFIQDVVMPFRKIPFSPSEHMKFLRYSIAGVAVFVFFWSLLFRQNESIFMYFAITGAIYLGGAGAVIIGGLYWNRGTTTAAWWTMIIGSILAVSGIIIRQIDNGFPINSQWIFFITICTSIALYVIISLLDKKETCNMDKLLHRGKYEIKDEHTKRYQTSSILIRLGVTSEFNTVDRITYFACLGWTLFWFGIFIAGSFYCLLINKDLSNFAWLKFWHAWLYVSLAAGIIVTIWLTWGGLIDMKKMFEKLKSIKRDDADDGTVEPCNLGE